MSRSQLVALGFTVQAIKTLVRRGRLHRVHRGVYAVGYPKLALRGRWMAAVLACGPGAVLSHRDAVILHDLRPIGSGWIHVTSASRHTVAGVRCHLARNLGRAEVVSVDGIPVTSVERALLDVAETDSGQYLRWAVEEAQRQDKLHFNRLEAVIAGNAGRHGIGALRQAMSELADEPGWTQSWLERRFCEIARAHRLPAPQTNVYVEGELVDAVWPERKLVVEVDGWRFHKTRRSFEDDRRKDAKLVVHHWRVVRFTQRRLTGDPAGVGRDLSALLAPDGPSPRPGRSGP